MQPNAVSIINKNDITLSVSAESCFDMIDNCQVTPPPLLSHMFSDDLKICQLLILPTFQYHSQANERKIKDVSAGCKSLHGMVLLGKKARFELPKVDTKSLFKLEVHLFSFSLFFVLLFQL